MYIYRSEKQLISALNKAQESLAYWESKSPEFWDTWKGKSKSTIIHNWKNVISQYEMELERYYKAML